MSVLDVAKKIHGVFNWLTSEPKNHWTLRELIPIITDNHVQPNPPRPINRVARVLERMATVAGLAGGAYMSVLEHNVMPMLLLPMAAQAAAWLSGGLLTMFLNKVSERTEQFELYAKNREFQKENKAALPRHQR